MTLSIHVAIIYALRLSYVFYWSVYLEGLSTGEELCYISMPYLGSLDVIGAE